MPPYYDGVRIRSGVCGGPGLKPTSLFVLYAPERQVDAWPSHARFLRDLVLEVLLRVPGHDQQAAVRQPLRKRDGAVFPPEPEQAFRAQTERGDDPGPFPARCPHGAQRCRFRPDRDCRARRCSQSSAKTNWHRPWREWLLRRGLSAKASPASKGADCTRAVNMCNAFRDRRSRLRRGARRARRSRFAVPKRTW